MSRAPAELPDHRRLRLQLLLLAVLAGGVLSIGLHMAGLRSLAWRWPLALAGGYLAALALQWIRSFWQRRPGEADAPRAAGGGGVECGDSGLELGDLFPPASDVGGPAGERVARGDTARAPGPAIDCSWRPMLGLIVVSALLGAGIDHWLPQAGSLLQALRLLLRG